MLRYKVGNIKLLLYIGLLFITTSIQAQKQQSYSSQASALLKFEHYEEASRMYSKAVSLSEEKGDMFSLFMLYNEWGGCKKHLGEYNKARELYGKSLNSANEASIPNAISDKVRLNLIMLLSEMGQFVDADKLLSTISTPQNEMQKCICEAEVNMRKGNRERALHIYNQLLNDADASKTFIARQNRGYLLSQSTNKDTLQLACQDIKESLHYMNENSDSYYITLSNLAITESNLGEFESALNHILKAEEWFKVKYQPTRSYPDYIIILRKKAEILMKQQSWDEAQKTYLAYYEKEKEYTVSNFASMTEQNRLDFWKKEKPFLTEIFALEDKCPSFLYDVALFRREVALLGGGADTKSDSIKLANQMQKRLLITGDDVRKHLRTDEIAIDFIRYSKTDGTQCYGAIVVSSVTSNRPVSFVPLWTEDELHRFKVGDRRLLSAVCSPSKKNDKNMIYNSSALADFIWKPLLSYIEKAQDVYFAPDGLLHMLAIEYITPQSSNGSQIRFHRQTSTANLLYRKQSAPKVQKTLTVGGLDYDSVNKESSLSANHDAVDYLRQYLNGRYIYFKYLEGTKNEVMAIDSIIPNVHKTFIQTEEQMKLDFKNKSYNNVHLATHGYALQIATTSMPYTLRDSITEDKSLLASGIALSGANVAHANSNLEDGLISAREFCEMDLSNISLLVVSACQSAQGTVSDEGPAGLLRGLKKAGVKSIIATLWEIDDDATKLFMKAFYASLNKTGNKHQALIAAQQSVKDYVRESPSHTTFDSARMKSITSPAKKEHIYSSPYYWAGFILVDE